MKIVKIPAIAFLVCWISFAFANFLYQAFADQSWGVATERSFFQLMIVATLYFLWKEPSE